MKRTLIAAIAVLGFSLSLQAETITVATYNIELFHSHFLTRRIAAQKPRVLPNTPEITELLDEEKKHEEHKNWETSEVILDPKFKPDIIVIQEGCTQEELEYFNHTFLKDAYSTVIVFPGNSDREQHVEVMIKAGFNIVQRKDDYYKELDSVKNDRGDRLFARGPAFLLIETPSKYRFWVGTNHQKSKSGNSVEVTQWRNREAKRTHQIIKDLEKVGPSDVIFMGDMNDELGMQEFELAGGGDAIANLVGPPQDGFVLLTKPLADAGIISYFGYNRSDFRSLIDHVIVTKSMKDQIEEVKVFQNNFTAVASDHCPVLVRLHSDPPGRN